MHRERVERITDARRMDLRLQDRQPSTTEESADAREQMLLVGKVDDDLQSRARAREPGLHDRLGALDAPVEMARVPGDFVGAVALEIDGVEHAPERLLGGIRYRVEAQQTPRLLLPLLEAVRSVRSSLRAGEPGRVAWNRSSSSFAFHAFHTRGLVPRMSATVSR